MHVHGGQFAVDAQAGDPGFLGRLAQRRGDDVGVVRLRSARRAAPSGPAADAGSAAPASPVSSSTSAEAVTWPGTQSRWHASLAGEHEASTACRSESCAGSARRPRSVSSLDRWTRAALICAPAGRRSEPGSRGPRAARPGSRSRWRPTAPSRRADPSSVADQVGGEDRRADPAAAHPAHRQRDQQRLHGRADRDGEHGVLGAGAGGIGIAVRAVGDQERDHEFGCVVEDLAARRRGARPRRRGLPSPVRSARHLSFIAVQQRGSRRPRCCSHTNRTGRVWCGAGAVSASATAALDRARRRPARR